MQLFFPVYVLDNKLIKEQGVPGKEGANGKPGAAMVALEDYAAIRVSHQTLESF